MPDLVEQSSTKEALELQRAVFAFVRGFGLLATHETPCGQAVPVSQAHALTELARQSLTQLQLGAALGLTKSTVSRLVDQLVDQRWATRTTDPTDGRRSVVVLTTGGRTRAQDISEARASRFRRLLDCVEPAEREHVTSAIRILAKATDAN